MNEKHVNWQQWQNWLVHGCSRLDIELNIKKIRQLEMFAKELLEAGRNLNLTSIEDPLEIAENLMLDSMMPGKYIAPGARVLDLGTGAGIPGIPLKIAFPELDLTLIDARRKRVNFVKYTIRQLGLENIEASHCRSEELARTNERFDVVVCRAVSSMADLMALASPLLGPGGMIVAMKGRGYEAEMASAGLAGHTEDSGRLRIEKYRLPKLDIDRVLVMVNF